MRKKADGSILYGSSTKYAIDRGNNMYYFVHPMDSLEEISRIIERGRRNTLYRIKEKLLNFYHNKISPRLA